MVSPSKKRKDRRGRENCECKEPGQLKTKLTGSKKSAKSFKPLVSKKFYLDIKNNATLQKLESKLKCFGARAERPENPELGNTTFMNSEDVRSVQSQKHRQKGTRLVLLVFLCDRTERTFSFFMNVESPSSGFSVFTQSLKFDQIEK